MRTFVSAFAVSAIVALGFCAPAAHAQDIVDVASKNPEFSTLVAAVKAAGLVSVLKSKGPFTVFAPTNAAFEKLPAGTVDMLLKPENKAKLVALLKYHVIGGQKIMASKVVGMKAAANVKTVNGATVKVSPKPPMVNNANIIKTDVAASNGVIHVIDTVLMPPMKGKMPMTKMAPKMAPAMSAPKM